MAPSNPIHMDIIPCAGLANRMRAIASAMSAAQQLGIQSLCIRWKIEYHCCAPFRDLFDMTALPAWIQVQEIPEGHPEPFQDEANTEEAWRELLDRQRAQGRPAIQLKSWAAFYDAKFFSWPSMCPESIPLMAPSPRPSPRWLENLWTLRFRPEIIAAAAANFPKGVAPPPVGVHIRRTDHITAIHKSPSAAFWAAMAKEETLWFYVASDDMGECLAATKQFPQQILLSSNPEKNRHSREGVVAGAVEFLTLSRCSKILGSYRSSFGEMAAAYGGIPFFPVRSDN